MRGFANVGAGIPPGGGGSHARAASPSMTMIASGGELRDASAESKAARVVARARVRGGGGGDRGARGRRQRRRHRDRQDADIHVFALAVRGRRLGRRARGTSSRLRRFDRGSGWRRFVLRERGAAVNVRVEVVEGLGGRRRRRSNPGVVSRASLSRGARAAAAAVSAAARFRLESRAKIGAARGVARGGESRGGGGGPPATWRLEDRPDAPCRSSHSATERRASAAASESAHAAREARAARRASAYPGTPRTSIAPGAPGRRNAARTT